MRNNKIDILVNTIHSLTGLRDIVNESVQSGIYNDVPNSAIEMHKRSHAPLFILDI